MVAADVRRRSSVRKTLPPRYLGGYGSCATVLDRFDYPFKPGTPFVQSGDFLRGTNAVKLQLRQFWVGFRATALYWPQMEP